MSKKKLGIVGGMGPLATIELFRQIVINTKSNNDSDHIRIFIDNNPQIPDRTNAILFGGESPVSAITASAKRLQELGADYLLIPCNTSHYFFDDIQSQISVEIVNMIEETTKYISQCKYKRIGLLATTGTIQSNVYQRHLDQYGIETVIPCTEDQSEVMNIIYLGVKAGNKMYDTKPFLGVIDNMYAKDTQAIVLGCTELPLIKELYGIGANYIDPSKILARAAIVKAGYELVESEQI